MSANISVLIASAAWNGKRVKWTHALCDELNHTGGFRSRTICSSLTPEPAHIWATRLWERAAALEGDYAVLLNDDVQLCPGFPEVLQAIISIRPDVNVGLYNAHPQAPRRMSDGERWMRCFWYTGPGVMLAPGQAKSLLAYSKALPKVFRESRNEDLVAAHWAYENENPFWLPMPTIVQHRDGASTMPEHDTLHPGLRTSPVPWELVRDRARMTEPSYWYETGANAAPLVNHPWATGFYLEGCKRYLETERQARTCAQILGNPTMKGRGWTR